MQTFRKIDESTIEVTETETKEVVNIYDYDFLLKQKETIQAQKDAEIAQRDKEIADWSREKTC